LAYGERGGGAAEKAVAELEALEALDMGASFSPGEGVLGLAVGGGFGDGYGDGHPANDAAGPPPEPAVVDLPAVTDELFRLCDWVRGEPVSSMVEPVCTAIFSPPLGEPEPQRQVLAALRPYPGCPAPGGTLLHLLSDFPLNHPAAANYAQLVSLLLSVCKEVVAVDARRAGDGHTPLFRACVHGHGDVAGLLVANGADAAIGCGPGGQTPLLAALAGAPEDPELHER
jgi:hypothetical protein